MIQSPNDNKQYHTITLNNGLRVLLVHHQESKKSAAALAVNVGHFSDPIERQGLAHFLEHMLFLGTEKYPEGSEYQKFISQYGGSNNAWTATEHTCFFFDIQADHFAPALDRFSQFFTAPLLSKEFVEKERKNIDAEYKLKLKDDIRRLYDVHKETINPRHPFSKFSVGNTNTLGDVSGKALEQEVRAFFEEYYNAQAMTLVLEGPQSLSELETYAQTLFSGIAETTNFQLPLIEPLYLEQHKKVKIKVKPVKNDRQLIISFAMPAIDEFYRNKPEATLCYLLGHEGPGSILSYLKKKRWSLGLTAGSGINGSNFKDFNISLSLTDEGEKHIDEIVSVVFSYIKLLKNAPIADYYYQEKKSISELAFHYHEKLKALDSVCQLVINMQHYPADDYIFGDYAMDGLDHEKVSYLLSFLTADNLRLIHISQSGEFTQQSKWYQVPFHIESICQANLEDWLDIKTNAALFLPPPNEFIVKKPKLLAAEQTLTLEQLVPKKVVAENGLQTWFKQDVTFKVPKGYIYIGIDNPFTIATSENIAMTRLFTDLYSDAVVEAHYDAELAGIHYHLYAHQGGMTLQLSGLSENQSHLLNKLLCELKEFQCEQDKFELFKQQLINHWHNAENSKSMSQLFAKLSAFMQPKNPTSNTLANVLEKVTFEQFQNFSQRLFTQISVEVFIHGNWHQHHAIEISNTVQSCFAHNLDNKYHAEIPILNLEQHPEITLPLLLPDHDHAAVIYYPMPDRDLKTVALTMVVSQILSPHFFQEMRTEKQFGYLVGVGFVPINRFPGLALYIQSPHVEAKTLISEINIFINKSKSLVDQLSEQDWFHLQHGLASQLLEKDTSLRIKSQRFWAAICNKETSFTQKQLLIQIIEQLTLNDINEFLSQQLLNASQLAKVNLISSPKQDLSANIMNNSNNSEYIENIIKNCSIKF